MKHILAMDISAEQYRHDQIRKAAGQLEDRHAISSETEANLDNRCGTTGHAVRYETPIRSTKK